jgi:hypothetical protein
MPHAEPRTFFFQYRSTRSDVNDSMNNERSALHRLPADVCTNLLPNLGILYHLFHPFLLVFSHLLHLGSCMFCGRSWSFLTLHYDPHSSA